MSKCSKCGTEITGQSKFCPNCGEKLQTSTQTIQLKCKACGGVLATDEDKVVLSCPYCGSKEIIPESENVTIERIRTKDNKELEEMRMKNDAEKESRQEEKNYVEEFKKGKFKKVLTVFAIIFGVLSLISFIVGNIPSGIIALIQVVLFVVAILMGVQVIKEKKRFFHILVAVVAFILTIPFFLLYGVSPNKNEKIDWDYIVLNEHLPEPNSNKGKILFNDDEYLDIYIAKTDTDDYNRYLTDCKEFGYIIDSDYSTTRYSAYNADGYELSLWFNDSDKEMNISLSAPEEMSEIKWPSTIPGCLLPTPDNLMGNEILNDSSSYCVDIANTTKEDYQNYVSACEEAGFTVDFSKSEDEYTALNKDGYEISVGYEGFNVMSISIYAPDEASSNETTTKAEAKETEVPTEKPTTAQTEVKVEMVNGMRKEFKEAMDSYEKFFDEYVEFMNEYATSDNSLAMLAEYADMMSQYSKTMSEFEDWNENEMNDAELNYYLEVQTRINEKLLEVAY